MKREKTESNQAAVPLMTYATHPRLMALMYGGWSLTIRYRRDVYRFEAEAMFGGQVHGTHGGSPLDAIDRLEKVIETSS